MQIASVVPCKGCLSCCHALNLTARSWELVLPRSTNLPWRSPQSECPVLMALENGKTSAVAVMDPPIVVTAWQLHPSLTTGTKNAEKTSAGGSGASWVDDVCFKYYILWFSIVFYVKYRRFLRYYPFFWSTERLFDIKVLYNVIQLYIYTHIYIYIGIYSRDTLHLMCWMLYQCVSNRTAIDAGGVISPWPWRLWWIHSPICCPQSVDVSG